MNFLNEENFKLLIIRFIQEDFKMICLQDRLDAVGFNGVDFPNITYEIFDLMGISEEIQASGLEERYWKWALASVSLTEEGLESYLAWTYEQLGAYTRAEEMGKVA